MTIILSKLPSQDDEEAPPYHDVYEDVEMPGGESTAGSDDELYASVSAKHKAKKRSAPQWGNTAVLDVVLVCMLG